MATFSFTLEEAKAAHPYFNRLHNAVMAADPPVTYFYFAINESFTHASIGVDMQPGSFLVLHQELLPGTEIPLGFNGLLDWLAFRVSVAITHLG